MPIDGAGRLFIGTRPVCDVRYHLIGWREGQSIEIRGSLRRLDGVGFGELLDVNDVALDLEHKDLWWNCRITTTWGHAVSREGALHQRPPGNA